MAKSLALFLMIIFYSVPSLAKYQISGATSYITRTANYEIGSEVVYEETRTPMEFKFGTVLNSDIYLGVIYNMGSRTLKSSSATRTEKLTAYGITIGYDTSDWYVHFSYYLGGELDLGNNQVFKEAGGYQIDFSKKVKWGSIYVIPQIAYSSLSFKKRESGGSEVEVNSSSFGGIVPQIAFMYEF